MESSKRHTFVGSVLQAEWMARESDMVRSSANGNALVRTMSP
jgi:hypothetical protein